MSEAVVDLLSYIDRSPTPYHAVSESARRLRGAGFEPVSEQDVWGLSPGDRCYVVRHDSSLLAFSVGAVSPADGGFRVVGAHVDSPNLRVKPLPDVDAYGYRQFAVEPYGGVLLHTWLDRDLSLAGRVTLRGETGMSTRTRLVDFARPVLRVPNLAIHLQREINKEGLKLNAQKHLAPIVGMEGAPELAELLATELRAVMEESISGHDILAFDLMAYDLQESVLAGVRGEFIHASRIDNLASCHAAICGLIRSPDSPLPSATRVVVLYDHEEVGSHSAQGAAGPFLSAGLERIVAGYKGGEPQGLARALARSMLISADMAHAVHPNYADRHEPGHRPLIGKGPVIKLNANQSYASDAETSGVFAQLCDRIGIVPQHFVTRSDLGCGSTIGPITAARVGIRTVDVGNPMLSMHSCREMAGSADVEPMIELLAMFFESETA